MATARPPRPGTAALARAPVTMYMAQNAAETRRTPRRPDGEIRQFGDGIAQSSSFYHLRWDNSGEPDRKLVTTDKKMNKWS
jgi:hypothetical protein